MKLSGASKNYNMGLISKNRDVIYGLSILWIMFFHSTITVNARDVLWGVNLYQIKNLGNIGVDIFLMVSGISLYFSFSKDENIFQFWKRRIYRVVLPVLIVQIPFCLKDLLIKQTGILRLLLDISGLSLFTHGTRTIWFVSTILFCYFIYPFVYKFLKSKNWKIGYLFLLILVDLVCNWLLSSAFSGFWKNSEVLFRRIPVFVLGTFLGKYVFENKELKIKRWHAAAAAMAVSAAYMIIISHYPVSKICERYSYMLIALPLVGFLSLLGEAEISKKMFSVFSPCTLEIYLTHEKLIAIFSKLVDNNLLANILAFFISIITAKILCYITNRLLSGLKKEQQLKK